MATPSPNWMIFNLYWIGLTIYSNQSSFLSPHTVNPIDIMQCHYCGATRSNNKKLLFTTTSVRQHERSCINWGDTELTAVEMQKERTRSIARERVEEKWREEKEREYCETLKLKNEKMKKDKEVREEKERLEKLRVNENRHMKHVARNFERSFSSLWEWQRADLNDNQRASGNRQRRNHSEHPNCCELGSAISFLQNYRVPRHTSEPLSTEQWTSLQCFGCELV